MAKPGREHAAIQGRIYKALDAFVEPRGLGEAVCEIGLLLQLPGETELKERAPDVAFFAAGRGAAPGTPAYKQREDIAPDLAVEIASPNQFRPEMTETAKEYVQAGTRLVWVFFPQWNEIDIFQPSRDSQTLKAEQQLDGGDVLPGFTHPVARFFPALDER